MQNTSNLVKVKYFKYLTSRFNELLMCCFEFTVQTLQVVIQKTKL